MTVIGISRMVEQREGSYVLDVCIVQIRSGFVCPKFSQLSFLPLVVLRH